MIYLRSFVLSGRITDADAEDIFQEAWLRFDHAWKNRRELIEDPRGYLFGIMRFAVRSHLRAAARDPAPLSNPALIPDPRAFPPDRLAAENEEREQTSRNADQVAAWRDRFRHAIARLQHTLRELECLFRERPYDGTDSPRPAKRGRGAPTKALRFRTITEETLPRIVSWLLKYFVELERGT